MASDDDDFDNLSRRYGLPTQKARVYKILESFLGLLIVCELSPLARELMTSCFHKFAEDQLEDMEV